MWIGLGNNTELFSAVLSQSWPSWRLPQRTSQPHGVSRPQLQREPASTLARPAQSRLWRQQTGRRWRGLPQIAWCQGSSASTLAGHRCGRRHLSHDKLRLQLGPLHAELSRRARSPPTRRREGLPRTSRRWSHTSLGKIGKQVTRARKTQRRHGKDQLVERAAHPLSYGPPWAHYLGGYQDRLLGGPLGLPCLRYTAPEGVEHKDCRGVVLD
jgi:hypothetical protein